MMIQSQQIYLQTTTNTDGRWSWMLKTRYEGCSPTVLLPL